MRRHLLSATAACAAAAASLGLFAGGALARTHRPTAPAAPTQSASATLRFADPLSVGRHAVDVPGRAIVVKGTVTRYVAGEHVTLETFLGRRRIATRRLEIHAAQAGRGRFGTTVSAPSAGTLTVKVFHKRDAHLSHFVGRASLQILSESTSDGLFVELVQARLAALHFYMPQSGRWDLQTELAVDAYHRLLGRGTSTTLDPATLSSLLDGQGSFVVRFPHQGRHVEGNQADELLALIDGSKVVAIYPMSSGKPSTPTILGSYQIYRRVPGYLPDGMYYSDFFIRGYAVHGYDPAPDYPASHGCMRLPISDAISAFDWLALGDWVDVYGAANQSDLVGGLPGEL